MTRSDVDRDRRISLKLGGREPAGTVALCDEIIRLHRLAGRLYQLLQEGEDFTALEILADESDPSWDWPLDHEARPVNNETPVVAPA